VVTWGSQNPRPTITLHTGADRLRTTKDDPDADARRGGAERRS